MLSLTKKTEYGLIGLCHLARAGATQVTSAREIADEHKVPLPLLMNILKELNQAEIIKSVRGAKGGYTLAKPAHELSLASLVEALEGPVKFVRCAEPRPDGEHHCDIECSCIVRRPLMKIHERMKEFLTNVTLAELAFDNGPAQLTQIAYPKGRTGDEPTNLSR